MRGGALLRQPAGFGLFELAADCQVFQNGFLKKIPVGGKRRIGYARASCLLF